MSFYLKLFLIMSFVGQSIAVACVDIIAGHHDARRTVFNERSFNNALGEAADEINGHSGSIREILDNKSNDSHLGKLRQKKTPGGAEGAAGHVT